MAEQFELVDDYVIRKPIDTTKETNIETETPNHQFFWFHVSFQGVPGLSSLRCFLWIVPW